MVILHTSKYQGWPSYGHAGLLLSSYLNMGGRQLAMRGGPCNVR